MSNFSQYANLYETPMCSDWIMDAQTEYGATETYGSHAHSPEVVNSTSLRQVRSPHNLVISRFISRNCDEGLDSLSNLTYHSVTSSQGTTSVNHSIPQEKISDSWKEGMESRMDFLQTNLTELLQLFKQGTAAVPGQPVAVVPDMTPNNGSAMYSEHMNRTPCLEPDSPTVCVRVTEDHIPQTMQGTNRQLHPSYVVKCFPKFRPRLCLHFMHRTLTIIVCTNL